MKVREEKVRQLRGSEGSEVNQLKLTPHVSHPKTQTTRFIFKLLIKKLSLKCINCSSSSVHWGQSVKVGKEAFSMHSTSVQLYRFHGQLLCLLYT